MKETMGRENLQFFSLFFFLIVLICFPGKGADNIISNLFFINGVTAKSRPLKLARRSVLICL